MYEWVGCMLKIIFDNVCMLSHGGKTAIVKKIPAINNNNNFILLCYYCENTFWTIILLINVLKTCITTLAHVQLLCTEPIPSDIHVHYCTKHCTICATLEEINLVRTNKHRQKATLQETTYKDQYKASVFNKSDVIQTNP